ncbi:MAG: ATP-binding protein [Desulfobacula sp.]|jgi:signal transduction histidine kinase/CheY-like chemotaxis protein
MGNPGMDFRQTGFNEKSARTAQIFDLLGTDCRKNIDIILEQTWQILDGVCSLYNRIDQKQNSLIVWAGHNTPQGLESEFSAKGHICWEATIKKENRVVAIPDIKKTPFYHSDPYVKQYNLKSYLGFPVKLRQKVIGSLCIVDTKTREFTQDDLYCIKALAKALSLEEERLLLENELVEEKEKYRSLVEKLERAKKMELIGTMAGGVAHDLNNILSGLVSYPELILMQLSPESPLKEPIAFMHDAGLRAAEIVQDLLTLTRRGIAVENTINLNHVIHDYFISAAHKRLEKSYPHIRFKIYPETDLLNIIGSPSHISKIIMNLVINATEAIREEGTVTVESFNRYLDMPLHGYDTISEGEYVVLRITDNGTGIPKKDLGKIFEPFYTKKQMGRSGSGLGLSVVWNCVKDHKGYIKVISGLNQGSTFELYFPATRKETGPKAETLLMDDFKGNKEAILVIDDVREQRKIARDSLKMLGYRPFTVASGEKAILFLKKLTADLIILDMKMEPGMDGLETYKQILKIHPYQKAIIASGFSENDRVSKVLKLGAGQYIKKPYTIKNLAHAIRKELANNKKLIEND